MNNFSTKNRTMKELKELLVIDGPADGLEGTYYLFNATTGQSLATHWCSCSGYAKNDLVFRRPQRVADFEKRWPNGIEVKWLSETDISQDEMIKRNHNFHIDDREGV